MFWKSFGNVVNGVMIYMSCKYCIPIIDQECKLARIFTIKYAVELPGSPRKIPLLYNEAVLVLVYMRGTWLKGQAINLAVRLRMGQAI
jgi:hypothetical protein